MGAQQSDDDPLALPPPERLREIAAQQAARAKAIRERRAREQPPPDASSEQVHAAEVIQRTYRGHRERRALHGWGLDPSTRWLEALKEAKYHNVTRPQSRNERQSMSPQSNHTRDRWRRIGAIANRAGSDDTSESESESDDGASDEQRARARAHRRAKKAEREKYAKPMGLEYFLEMVDQKHRYGSNLRRYHQEWKHSDTHENFFYWLDYGEGKDLDLEDRPRARLDTEHVRYLSREERQRYLVHIDAQGRFCWAKDGLPITTSPAYKDSINGIVRADDRTPSWRKVSTGGAALPDIGHDGAASSSSSSSASSISGISTGSQADGSKYTNPELHDAKGLAKLNHLSVDSLVNHLLRKTTKKNTWIFVADTSFRLYIGIKQSGAFQHSSFLRGARVSAAGLIKIKRGQLRRLSPLSGHYAPPLKNFREFVKNLREAGADLSRCNVSRSYAVLLGLEGYISIKKRGKHVEQSVKDVFHPDEKRRREEAEKDKSRSAQKEREVLSRQEQAMQRERRSLSVRFKKTLGIEGDGDDGGDAPNHDHAGKTKEGPPVEAAAAAATAAAALPPSR